MSTWRISAVAMAGLALPYAAGCRLLESGPSDEEVRAAIRKAPPFPPTLGPTYLADVAAVEIQQRGRYNAAGRYWPLRLRVTGNAQVKPITLLQLGLPADHRKAQPEPVDFSVEGKFTKDDFGDWRVSFNYDPAGPRWRLDGRANSRGDR